MNYYSDEPEWQYHFKNSIDWDSIIPLYYPSFPTEDGFNNQQEVLDFLEEIVTATGEWTGNALTDRAKHIDEEGAGTVVDGCTIPGKHLSETYREAKELQYFGLSAPVEYGGMGIPGAASIIAFGQANRADMGAATQMGFFISIIDMIERFCDKEDRDRLIPQMVAGDLSGAMCLTEPGSGSDVGSLTSSAVKNEDGTYTINGTKMFITNGGGGLGFVLARIKGAPEGLAGISLFLVEQFLGEGENRKMNYRVTKNEEKLGLHSSFTCEVVYENSIGKLVGKEHKGFQYMLHLMNEARIAVGVQGIGGLEACIHYAKEYAKERIQFGKTLMELPLYKRNMDDWETERDAFRALIVDTMSEFDIYQKLDMDKRHGVELTAEKTKLLKDATKVVRRRTPLVKAYGSEAFARISQDCIQALGGYGFIMEYEAQRFHRDSFATLLYEGTTQIQSLMAMKDLMKYILRSPAKFFASMLSSNPVANVLSGHTKYQREFLATHYEFKKNLTFLIVKTLKPDVNVNDPTEVKTFFTAKNWMKEENFNKLMIHAETICEGMSYMETIRVLTKHATKNEERSDLLGRYRKLVQPRLEGIYCDWRQW